MAKPILVNTTFIDLGDMAKQLNKNIKQGRARYTLFPQIFEAIVLMMKF